MVVFLDAGTTCQSVVPYLGGRKNITVVTNDFYVVTSLFAYPNIETIHTGGVVDPSSASSSGRIAADAIKSINIDLFFLSTGTWNMSRGVTTPSMDKVEVKLAALEASSSCFLLADSTKFGTCPSSMWPRSKSWTPWSPTTNCAPGNAGKHPGPRRHRARGSAGQGGHRIVDGWSAAQLRPMVGGTVLMPQRFAMRLGMAAVAVALLAGCTAPFALPARTDTSESSSATQTPGVAGAAAEPGCHL